MQSKFLSPVLFGQAACVSKDHQYLMKKNYYGLFIAIVGLLICISFKLSVSMIHIILLIDEKLKGTEIVQSSEYTVTGHISQHFFVEISSRISEPFHEYFKKEV